MRRPRLPSIHRFRQVSPPSSFEVSTATDTGLVRHNNEDAVRVARIEQGRRRFSVWAVADGVGGGPLGEEASKTAIDAVIDMLGRQPRQPFRQPAAALTQAFGRASQRVYEITGSGAAASTLVVALVSEADATATIANVGDSRAYLVQGEHVRQLTQDHSVVAERVAAGLLTPAEARKALDRNVLTRSVGSEREVVVDVFGPVRLASGDRLVLCTDGVHGMIAEEEIRRLCAELPIADAPGALVAAALRAGGHDNATALVGGLQAAR